MGASVIHNPAFSRVLPFGLYMLFVLAADYLEPLMPPGFLKDHFTAFIYPLKTVTVVAALAWCWKSYDELREDRFRLVHLPVALLAGVVVFALWIQMDWDFAVMGKREGYDPGLLPGQWYYAFLAVRLAGAALVVPLFEELFWRSFVLRYIINQDFRTVKIGAFSWMSFVISSLLFGSEHNLWLAGIVAGVIYNLLLYWSRSLYACIIAHGLTNLLLGIYVIRTGNWQFW